MKSKLFLILLLFNFIIYSNNNAQQYKSVFEKNATWNIVGYNEYVMTLDYKLSGDSVIDNVNYKCVGDFFLREDLLNSRLYAKSSCFGIESIVMDLNLLKNDTFYLNYSLSIYNKTIAIVDSVYFINGRKIIEFNYPIYSYQNDNKLQNLKFIEGIGPNVGFTFQSHCLWFDLPVLLCYENDLFSWKNELYDTCYLEFVDVKKLPSFNEVICYPNPANSFFQIKCSSRSILTIYEISGKKIKEIKLENENEKINTSELKNGYYLIQLYNNGKVYKSKLCIIKK